MPLKILEWLYEYFCHDHHLKLVYIDDFDGSKHAKFS